MRKIPGILAVGIVSLFHLGGCVYYPPMLPPVRPAEFYSHRVSKEGVTLACHPFSGEAETRMAFGADLSKARILPLEILIFNGTKSEFNLSNMTTRLTDAKGHQIPALNPEDANARVKKHAGRRLGAWSAAGALMIFFTLPAIFRGDEGKAMHKEPIQALKQSRTAVLAAGGKPITLSAAENVRWFNYYDISTYGEGMSKDLLKEDLFLEVGGVRGKTTGNEHTFTILIPFSEESQF